MRVQIYHSFKDLPDSFNVLFESAEKKSIFLCRQWFELFEGYVLKKDNHTPVVYCVTEEQKPVLIMPFFLSESKGYSFYNTLYSASNYYSSLFLPICKDDSKLAESLNLLFKTIFNDSQKVTRIRINPIPYPSKNFDVLCQALNQNGFTPEPFFSFGNWSEKILDRTYQQYFNQLPGALKSTIKRKAKKIQNNEGFSIQILTSTADVVSNIQDYQQVYAQSWKIPEPYPDFIKQLTIRFAKEKEAVRLGLVRYMKIPVAAQIWFVLNKKAYIFKLAYTEHEAYKKLSVGTVLTARLFEYVINTDNVESIDYLTGDDAYKRDWMRERKEFWGIMAYNRRTLSGLSAIIMYRITSRIKWFLNLLR